MSFSIAEKLGVVRERLQKTAAFQKLNENEQWEISLAIYDALEEIEQLAFTYKMMKRT